MRRVTSRVAIRPPLLAIGLMGLFCLTGCEQAKWLKQRVLPPASGASGASGVSGTASTPVASGKKQENNTVKINHEPIVYPFSTWQQQPANMIALNDVQAMVQSLSQRLSQHLNVHGKPITPTQNDKSLDFIGNVANQYRFANPTAPHFNLLDSKEFVELQWYHASAYDFGPEKKLSIAYAEQVYQLARGWLGEQAGATLVEDILVGKTVTHQRFSYQTGKTLKAITVADARCQAFSCRIVLKK